jgi:dTDP-4-dehydrorhamnose 3,5-epimerase
MRTGEIGDRDAALDDDTEAAASNIDGVQIVRLPNVTLPNGFVMEMVRTDWPAITGPVQQVNWFQLDGGSVTGWHCHTGHSDHLVGVLGTIRLALWDGRDASPSQGATQVVRLDPARPTMVVVPPGVWHGLRNESGEPAGYVQVLDALYNHKDPDSRRLPLGTPEIPDIL